MRLRSALLVATVLATPLAVQAQPVDGLYVGAGAGFNYKQQQSVTSFQGVAGPLAGVNLGLFNPTTANNFFGTGGNTGLNLNYNPGWVALASIGYGLGNGLRVELEGNIRQNRLRAQAGTSRGSMSSAQRGPTPSMTSGLRISRYPSRPRGESARYSATVSVSTSPIPRWSRSPAVAWCTACSWRQL